MSRYARQMILPEIGAEGQARIGAGHVLVIGAGGLGVPVLQYLAAAGAGQITLVDPDLAEESNLHRQPIYAKDLGQPKACAAKHLLHLLNPDTRVTALVDWLTPENAPALVAAADIVLDCADSFAVSYILSDCCLTARKPFITASALGLSGYVGGFCGPSAPSLRALFPDLPDSLATCATAGVLGPVVGLFGMIQAQMALAVLVGMQPSPLGQLLRYDMAGFRSSGFRFDTAPEPAQHYPFIAASALRPDDFLVELRAASEAPEPVSPAAQRLQVEDFGADGPRPAPGQRAVFACRSGLRAWRAADRLHPHWPGEIALLADTSPRKGHSG